MATGGHFNHYDDPDEFWDEQPLQRPAREVDAARGRSALDVGGESIRTAGGTADDAAVAAVDSRGSPLVSMALDRGFLPVGIDFEAGWRRYVRAHEVGAELMRAYQVAVSTRMEGLFAGGRVPSPWEVSETAVPDHRTMLAILLETTSWEQFTTVSSAIVTNEDYEVFGATVFRGFPAVSVRANRDYLSSITVAASWAESVDPLRVSQEVLRCAEEIRARRPRFVVAGDYSRYSEADLEFALDRHRQRLFEGRAD